jgi:hypothetical protein
MCVKFIGYLVNATVAVLNSTTARAKDLFLILAY